MVEVKEIYNTKISLALRYARLFKNQVTNSKLGYDLGGGGFFWRLESSIGRIERYETWEQKSIRCSLRK